MSKNLLLPVIVAIGLVASLSPSAPGTQAPDGIVVPADNELHEPIVARLVTSLPEGAQVRGSWDCPTCKHRPGPDANTIHIWAPEGTHVIKATGIWVLTRDVKVGDQVLPILVDFGQYEYSREFRVGKEVGPDPPGPTPTPVSEPWLVVIEETRERTPELGDFYLTLRQTFPRVHLLIADKDQPEPVLQSYVKLLPGTSSLPYLFVVDGREGRIVHKGSLPLNIDEIRKYLESRQ